MTLKTTWSPGEDGHANEHNRLAVRVNRVPSIMDYSGDTESQRWQAAIDSNIGGRLYIPAGVYPVDASVILSGDILIEAAPGAVLQASAPMDFVFGNVSAWKNITIQGLQIDANHQAAVGLSLYYIGPGNKIEQVRVKNAAGDGILMRCCMAMEARNSISSENGGAGWNLLGCNALALYVCRAQDNVGSGFAIASTTINNIAYQGGLFSYGISSEGNERHGVEIAGVQNPFYLAGAWIEGNTLDGINTAESIGSITGCRISGLGTGTNHAIHLTGSAKAGVIVTGNKLASIPPGGNENYHMIMDETGIAHMENNWNGGAEWMA